MRILDISAGHRAIWLDKDCDLVTFLDRRPEAQAHFFADSRAIPAEVGTDFDLIVFDPPHVNMGAKSEMAKRYGHATLAEIRSTIEGSGAETHRVTRPGALMAFKWNDHDLKLDTVLGLMAKYWRPLFGQHLKNRGGAAARSQSFWVMLLRRDL